MTVDSDETRPRYSCADCPRWFQNIDDMHYLNGNFYCPDCFDNRTRLDPELAEN